ncbi:hypothetical protein AVEN_34524-1 [Araneus ventricosus]|uniref:Tc1-like transposase DDE domain-containing protein n=1 Tax=Araneus ventricosus TaxID=182803 RepID=A0A4Y2LKP7_ARAVE|nr:hypothetical protein AVEN_34524-1 [Araneus ventricosus]
MHSPLYITEDINVSCGTKNTIPRLTKVGSMSSSLMSRYSVYRVILCESSSRGVVESCGGIISDGLTPVNVFDEYLVPLHGNRDEVSKYYVRFYRKAVDEDFIFMDENAKLHRDQFVDDFLEKNCIRRIVGIKIARTYFGCYRM